VGDDEHRGAKALVQMLQHPQHLAPGGAVERAGGLVAEQHVGLLGHSAGDGDTLLLAAGQLAGEMAAPRAQPHQRQRLVRGHRVAGDLGHQLDVLLGGERGHEVVELEDEAEMVAPIAGELPVGHRGQLAVAEPCPPRAGPVEPAEDVEKRRLAAARGPEQHHDLARRQLQVDPAQRVNRRGALTVGAGQGFGPIGEFSHGVPSMAASLAVLSRACLVRDQSCAAGARI
jgi:hypothetical protein